MQKPAETDTLPTRSNTPQARPSTPEDGTLLATWSPFINNPAQGSAPAWSPNVQEPTRPPPPAPDNKDERRRGIPPWSPLYGAALGGEALLGSGQISTPGAPLVQGTPQMGGVPGVTGSPSPYTNPPVTHPMQGPGNAPVTHPIQGPGNASISHPVQGPTHAPISHPIQGPVNPPITHPVQGPTHMPPPQPIQQPPEQPGGTPTHKHHRHHDHPDEHKHPQHSTHPGHELHRAARVTKVAGGSTVKSILIVVVAAAVVAAGGIVAHFLSRPQPLISITSNYKVGSALAGANGTVLHISGQQFSGNSAITFLLDGQAAPGNPGNQSDSNGNFSTNMTITSAWSVGTHTLTARDASNDSTKNSVSVTIVQPGQANTPGPNGAPPDDASFRLKVTIANALADPFSQNPVLIITGHPDPEGGTVCSPDDSGQSLTYREIAADGTTPFTKTISATCSGTYKAGQISYIETSTTIKQYWQINGVNSTCVRNNPTVDLRLTGTYVGNNTFKGTLDSPYFTYTCDQGPNTYHEASQGVAWTGTIVTQ